MGVRKICVWNGCEWESDGKERWKRQTMEKRVSEVMTVMGEVRIGWVRGEKEIFEVKRPLVHIDA